MRVRRHSATKRRANSTGLPRLPRCVGITIARPSTGLYAAIRRFTCSGAARASRSVDCDAVAYLSPFENHPPAVAALARGRRLWGNPPDVLARVRDLFVVAAALRARGFVVPEVRAVADAPPTAQGARLPWHVHP